MTADQDRFDHDRMEEAVAAYALDALEEEERAEVRTHIEGCPSCRAALQRMSVTVRVLPLAVDDMRPPDRLRERILAAAAVTPAGQAEPLGAPRIIPFPGRPGPSEPQRMTAAARGAGRGRMIAFGAAVAVLVIGLGALSAVAISLQNQLRREQQLANRPPPTPSQFPINGTGTLAAANGQVTQLPSQNVALVALGGLPQIPTNKVYQLWVIPPGKDAIPVSQGVFTPDRFGNYTLVVKKDLPAGTTIAITREDGPSGAAQPTEKPQLAGVSQSH